MNRRKMLGKLGIGAGAVATGIGLAPSAAEARGRRKALAVLAARVAPSGEVVEELTGLLWTNKFRRRGSFWLDGEWSALGYGDRIVLTFEAVDPIEVVDPGPDRL